ncbi:MAG: S8 family peptidase [Chitinophagales bacterium]|jgi:hypothetical protein
MRNFNKLIIAFFLTISISLFGQNTHDYYVVLKNYSVVPTNFNKSNLLTYINGIYGASSLYNNINNTVTITQRAFPIVKTPLLKKVIFIRSTTSNLQTLLNAYGTHFEFAEKIPNKVPAYSNDYYTCTNRSDSLTPTSSQTSTICVNTQLNLIRAGEAWNISKGDHRIKVGVEDWHIEQNHEDYSGVIDAIYANGAQDNHGTEVSGMAVGRSNNGKGIASITGGNCKLVFVDTRTTLGLDGLLRMSQHPGVRAVNASWGGRMDTASMRFPLISNAVVNEIVDSNNVVFVAAAGNGSLWGGGGGLPGMDTSWVWPSALDNVLCVTSVGHMEAPGSPNRYAGWREEISWRDVHLTGFRNGQSHMHNSRVDVCAPGYLVALTTINALNGGYRPSSGTSYASPMTAGLCALIASTNPCLTARQIFNIVKSTANNSIYSINLNTQFAGRLGTGRIDAFEALKEAMRLGTNFQQNRLSSGSTKYSSGNTTIWGNTLIVAGRNVTGGTQGNVIIPNGSNVKYESFRGTELHDGFEVHSGSSFEIIVRDSPCF